MFKNSKWVRFFGLFAVSLAVFSLAIVVGSPSAEARISVGERIVRKVEDNIVRSIDKIQRAYEDDYIQTTRDRLRIKRNARNQMLKEVYAAKYEAKYRPEVNRYQYGSETSGMASLSAKEQTLLNVINSHMESGQAIHPNTFNERRLIIRLCESFGIPYRIDKTLIYVSK